MKCRSFNSEWQSWPGLSGAEAMFADEDFFWDALQKSKCPKWPWPQPGDRTRKTKRPRQIPVAVVLAPAITAAQSSPPLSLEVQGKRPKEHLPLALQFFPGMHCKCPNVQNRVYHIEIMDINQIRGVLGVPTGANLCFTSPHDAKRKAPTAQAGASKVMLLKKTCGLTIAPRL